MLQQQTLEHTKKGRQRGSIGEIRQGRRSTDNRRCSSREYILHPQSSFPRCCVHAGELAHEYFVDLWRVESAHQHSTAHATLPYVLGTDANTHKIHMLGTDIKAQTRFFSRSTPTTGGDRGVGVSAPREKRKESIRHIPRGKLERERSSSDATNETPETDCSVCVCVCVCTVHG